MPQRHEAQQQVETIQNGGMPFVVASPYSVLLTYHWNLITSTVQCLGVAGAIGLCEPLPLAIILIAHPPVGDAIRS